MRIGVLALIAMALAAAGAADAQERGQEDKTPAKANTDFRWMFGEGKPLGVRTVISGSMTPAMQVGDSVAVFTMIRPPRRGDVLLFEHPKYAGGIPLSKHVVGLPGDKVKMTDGRLYLNGERVARTLVRKVAYLDPANWTRVITMSEYSEQLPGEDKPHLIHEYSDGMGNDNTPEFTVPDGHLFMVGDNRDMSYDSRAASGYGEPRNKRDPERRYTAIDLPEKQDHAAIGFVPIGKVEGRVRTVMRSDNPCNAARAEAAGAECLVSAVNQPM